MFDISWTEFLLIGVVALIVIGPKELPGVMRTLGQYTRKARSMAAEFQSQFQEAMREAEMTDLKKQVDDIASDIKNYDPLKEVKSDFESMGQDFQKSLDDPSAPKAAEASPEGAPAPVSAGEPPLALTPEAPTSPQPDAMDGPAAPADSASAAADHAAPAPSPEPAASEPASPVAAAAATEPAVSERS